MGQIASLIESADFFPPFCPPRPITPGLDGRSWEKLPDIFRSRGRYYRTRWEHARVAREIKELIAKYRNGYFGGAEIRFRFSIS